MTTFTCTIDLSTATTEELTHLMSLSHGDLVKAFQRILEHREIKTGNSPPSFDGVELTINTRLLELTSD